VSHYCYKLLTVIFRISFAKSQVFSCLVISIRINNNIFINYWPASVTIPLNEQSVLFCLSKCVRIHDAFYLDAFTNISESFPTREQAAYIVAVYIRTRNVNFLNLVRILIAIVLMLCLRSL